MAMAAQGMGGRLAALADEELLASDTRSIVHESRSQTRAREHRDL